MISTFSSDRVQTTAALVAGVLLVLFGVDTATAGSWAVVNGDDGSLEASRGVEANFMQEKGLYQIVFKKKLFDKKGNQRCVPVATLISGSPSVIIINVSVNPALPQEVEIETIDDQNTLVSSDFNLALIC